MAVDRQSREEYKMANANTKCRKCRREGEKLFLKGTKCNANCPFIRRSYVPGQHGLSRKKKLSDYGVMLREKQKVKRIYGILEKQFENYFRKAEARQGITGELLLQLLESRLDNIIYRMGFATSRAQAKQLATHGIFAVNGRKTDIPSRALKPGDEISVIDTKKSLKYFENIKELKTNGGCDWVLADLKNLKGTYKSYPAREQLDSSINEQLIVEFYSK